MTFIEIYETFSVSSNGWQTKMIVAIIIFQNRSKFVVISQV